MSVGGRVVEVIVLQDRVWVNTREPSSGDECAIYVERTAKSRSISEGDSLWWQGRHAMWTPKNRAFFDMELERIGYSGVPRPDRRLDRGGDE